LKFTLPARAQLWVKDYLPDSLTGLSAASYSVAGTASYFGWSKRLVVVLLLLGAVFAVGSIVSNRKLRRPTFLGLDSANTKLRCKLDTLQGQIDTRVTNLVDVVQVLLRDLATNLDIYKGDTRLSVYRHSGDQFYLVGRVSPNESYAAVGRRSYPDTQGFIGDVWRNPDDKTYVAFPRDRTAWIETQVESFGFTRDEAEKLKMQTVAMMATKLLRDAHGEAFGVLCIECIKARATVKLATLNAVHESPHFHTLNSVLDISVAGLTHDEVKRCFLGEDEDANVASQPAP
jgi:hypothetical protein